MQKPCLQSIFDGPGGLVSTASNHCCNLIGLFAMSRNIHDTLLRQFSNSPALRAPTLQLHLSRGLVRSPFSDFQWWRLARHCYQPPSFPVAHLYSATPPLLHTVPLSVALADGARSSLGLANSDGCRGPDGWLHARASFSCDPPMRGLFLE